MRHPGGWLGEDIDYLYDFIASGDPARRDYCIKTYRDGEFAQGRDRQHGDYDDFWAKRDLLNFVGNIKAAVLMSHAFNDWNVVPEHSVRIYDALKGQVPLQAYYHQGGHGGAPPLEMQNKWFTRYLYGVENGVEKEPKAWIVREAGNDGYDRYDGYGRDGPWPGSGHAGADAVCGLSEPGGVGGGSAADFRWRRARCARSVRGAEAGHRDTRRRRLVHRRAVGGCGTVAEPIDLRNARNSPRPSTSQGSPASRCGWRRASRRRTCPCGSCNCRGRTGRSGTANLITRGWADPQNFGSLTRGGNYDSKAAGVPLVPGQFVTMTFDLEPDDQIIPAGKRIGLMIFSSDRDFTLWPKPGTELTVDLDGTTLTLPVVGGTAAFGRAIR